MSNQAPIQTSISTFIDNNEGTLDPTGANNKNYSVADLRFSEGYSDADGNAGGIAITSVDSTKGILWYSTDTGNTWSKVLGVDAAHALLLTATSNNLLYYQAVQTLTNVNYNGTNNAVFTYRAWDQTTGVNGGLANTSINGNTSAFSQVERVVDGVILDINDAPTLTLSTTQSRINHSSPVKVFDNINAGAGEDDTGVNALIKQIVLNVTGVKNSNNEILTINGVDIPLKATATVFTLPDGGICKVVGTASILTLTLINDTGWVSTGVNNQVNQLLDSVTYKNVYVTSTVADIEGERVITVRSMTDLGTQSTGNNAYAPKNTASFANLISKVMIDKTAPNAPITVTVPENDGVGITPIEAQNGTEVVVSLVGTNALEGDVIRVVVKNLAPIQYTLLGTDILNNSASVTIPQATLQAAGQGTAPVVVTITDAANNTSVPSTVNINLVVQNTAPTGAPAITGTPTQGQVLTASLGTLADIDGLGTLSYKWYANGTEIIGATASTLTLTQAQVNKTITVSASYTDGLGKLETVSSVATAAVANVNDLPTGLPTITGTAMQGQVLTASSIGINDLDGLGTISYKWYANGTEITGATATTYTLTQAEVGKAITVKASYIDGGNTLETVSSAATANVTNVNDAPSATSSTITLLEDGSKTFAAADFGFSDVDGNTLSAVIISTLPAAGTLKLSGVAVTAGQSIPVASLGNLIYTPAANANGTGYASIGFKVQDNGGVVNGGIDTSAAATLTINVTPVNDAPSATSNTITLLEDGSKTFTAADFGFSDVDGNTLSAVIISTLPAAGTLKLSGVAVTAGQSIPVASLGNLVYTPAANANGTGYASIGFKVQDNGGVANGGVDTSAAATLTINVTPVNDAPSATSSTITLLEDGSKTFAAADFGFSDVDGNTLSAVIISTLPAAGTLKLSGVAVTAGQSIPVASLGNLVYTPVANANGTGYASIGFKVQDNGGVANGGVDTSTAATLTINVTPVNDVPSATSSTITVVEDGSKTFAASDFGFSDVDGNTLSAVIISTLPAAGTLKLSGVAVTAGQSIPVASLGNLVYTPAANANGTGYASIGFKVQDNGGVANGGVDTSTAATLTINVTPVNDAPSATSSTITLLEDGSKTFAAADFGFSDVDGNTLSAVIISTLPAAGTLKLSGVAVTAGQSIPVASLGNLVYTPAANANGSGYASIGFKVQDNGGVANGGVDTSAAATLTINVTPVNDAPSATSSTITLLEDGSKTFAAANFGFSDVDGNTLSAVIISTLPAAGTLKLSGVAVTAGQSIPVASLGNLVYTPAANANGTAYASIGFKVQDNGGVANGGIDTSAAATLTINVTPVNDAPTLVTQIPDQMTMMGTAFSYTMPTNTFADVDSTLTYSATRGDGTALPAWMTFNPTTATFTGTPTSTIDFNVKVIASDGALTVSDTFHIGLLPVANSAAITSATGIQNNFLNVGDIVTVTVTFSELVNVTGTPQLTLNIGASLVKANYVSGTGSTALAFSYTILANQTDANGISIGANSLGLNGGTITDASGNNATQNFAALADNISYMVDTTAPSAGTLSITDTGSNATDGITNNGVVTVGSLETGATWEYSTDSGSTWTTGTGTSFTLSEGTYAANAVQMRETDKAGNLQTGTLISKISSAITLDTIAPSIGTLALASDTGTSSTDGITKNGTINVGSLETGATWEYSTDSGNTWTTGTGTSFTLSAGNYAVGAVQMRETDQLGNVQTGSLIAKNAGAIAVDTTAPVIGNLSYTDTGSSATDGITKNATIAVASLESGATWEYSKDSGTTWATGTGTSFTLGAGTYAANAIQMRETDKAGNVQTGTLISKISSAITLDSTAPTMAVTMSNTNLSFGQTSLVTFTASETVTNFTNSDVTVLNGTLSTLTTTDNKIWKATYTPTINVLSTSNQISVAANSYTDVAGNNGAAATGTTYAVSTSYADLAKNLGVHFSASDSSSVSFSVIGMSSLTSAEFAYPNWSTIFANLRVNFYSDNKLIGTTPDWTPTGMTMTWANVKVGSQIRAEMHTVDGTGSWNITYGLKFNYLNSTRYCYTTPLALDLNGDGVQTIAADSGVEFDLLNTGTKQSLGWLSKQDGWLAMDLNGDGQINSGAELFGEGTTLEDGSLAKDGWSALAVLDTNADNKIDMQDTHFNDLRVWVDANSDGLTDAGELHTLAQVNVQSIDLNHDGEVSMQNGNLLQGFSTFTTTDGQAHEMVDALVSVDAPELVLTGTVVDTLI